MPNFSAKITNNAIGSLIAQQAVIATTSNNIANVNTPGYARRTLDLETRVASARGNIISVGNGVQIGGINRVADSFVDRLWREATGDKAAYETEDDFLNRVQSLFSLYDTGSTIGSSFTEFFNAVNDLGANPASIELRTNVIERATDLVHSINVAYTTVASLQTEADQRIATEIETVNSLTSQIASLNRLVSARELTGGVAADERDQRDVLLRQLAEKISFDVNEQADGQINITLAKGFAIVSGDTARALEVSVAPSFNSGGLPPSLAGGILSYIVYDYDSGAGASHIDLTQSLQQGQGTIGALLKVRGYADPANTSAFQADGSLVEVASRIEAYTRNLLTDINTTYLGPDENGGAAGHQPSSGDLYGNTPSVYGLFDFAYAGAKDVNADGLPNDLNAAALGIDNFSSILQLAFSDPRRFAAARDANVAVGAVSFPSGDGQNVAALTTALTSNHTFTMGTYSFTGSFEAAYQESLTRVGSLKARSETNKKVAAANLLTAENKRDEVSGVSLDEEFTNLIKFQKAFQASARMIKVADEMLEQVVSLV